MRSSRLLAGFPSLLMACGGGTDVPVTPAPAPPAAVARVDVAPQNPSVRAGQSVTFTAATFDANNGPLSGRTITWSSSATNVATVSTSGTALAIAPGTTTITATSEGRTGTTQL